MSKFSISTLDEITMNTSASVSDRNASTVSLIQLIQDFVLNQQKLNENTNTLSPEGLKTINVLLMHELNMLNEIDKHLTSIFKNGKMDVSDIPDIILLIKNVCNMYSPKLKKLNITRGELLKFIHDILIIVVKSDLTHIEDQETCIKVINASTNVLEATIELDETISCFCFPFLSRNKK